MDVQLQPVLADSTMNSRKGGAEPFVAGTTDSSKEKSISEISSISVDQLNHGVADISLDSAQDDSTMNSRKGVTEPFVAGTTDSSKEKSISEVSSISVNQLNHGVPDISLDSAQDGEWEVYTKKSKSRASNASKLGGSQNSNPKAWGNADGVQKLGMQSNSGSGKGSGSSLPIVNADSKRLPGKGSSIPQSSNRAIDSNYTSPVPVISPALQHGWNWKSVASTLPSECDQGKNEINPNPHPSDVSENKVNEIGDDDDSDAVDDTDDELFSDDWDSDESQKSHNTRKKSRWFNAFFDILDKLTVEQINEPARQWHCPACQNGPGAIDWYQGLQPLMSHAKTKGSNRVKLHREFAEFLDEELHRRGTSVIPAGEAYGKWKGLDESVKDHEIVWPPMVVIMNTRLEKDDNEKWLGMGNQELLDYFSSYCAVRARHSYGPQGHRGMSVLIFESSAIGYLEAERLDKHFKDQGTDREAWDHYPVFFYPGGQRQLYGYMAEKGDMDIFNRHSSGKSKLKFEMRSYKEVVVGQMKKMSEDNQQLVWFKNKVAKEQRHSKALKESFGILSEKLQKTSEENRIVRQRTKKHHEENKEEMDYLELFFKEQLRIIQDARDAREDSFEKMQQQEREKVKQTNSSDTCDHMHGPEEIAKFIEFQDKEMEEFVAEREKLLKEYEEKKISMKKKHGEEEVGLEREFDAELDRLMEEAKTAATDGTPLWMMRMNNAIGWMLWYAEQVEEDYFQIVEHSHTKKSMVKKKDIFKW